MKLSERIKKSRQPGPPERYMIYATELAEVEAIEKEVKQSNGIINALCGIIDNLKSKLSD